MKPLRCLFLTAAFLLSSGPLHAQAFALGGPQIDQVTALAQSADGATFVGGFFDGAMDVDPGPGDFPLTGAATDGFVVAYDADGAVRWAFALGGAQFDVVRGLAFGDGAVFVTGRVHGEVDFDPTDATFLLQTTNDTDDAFLASYDAATGALNWAFLLGTAGEFDEGLGLDVHDGTLYATGAVHGLADADPGPGEALIGTTAGAQDVYLASYTAGGALNWAFDVTSVGAVGGTYDAGYGVAADGDRVVLTGSFSSQADFDPGPGTAVLGGSPAGFPVAFLASYTPTGDYAWAHEFDGGDFPDGGTAADLDGEGNVYATGFFNDTVDFDPGPGTATFSASVQDGYLVSFTPDGTFRWALALQGPAFENVNAVAVAPDAAHLYVGGSFSETVDFDPGPDAHEVTATAYDDLFVASYTTEGGAFRWVFHAGDPPAPGYFPGNFTNALAAGTGYVVAGGGFDGTIDLEPGPGTTLVTTAGEKDGFVAAIGAYGTPVANEPSAPGAAGPLTLTAYPNPFASRTTLALTLDAPRAVTVEVLDALGRRVAVLHDGPAPAGRLALPFDARELPGGVYLVRASGGGEEAIRVVTVVR